MSILVLDCNKDSHWLYRRKLLPLTRDITCVDSVDSCKDEVQKREYSLVLLRHEINNSSGEQVYADLRKDGYSGKVVIVASGNGIEKIESLYSGIERVLSKATNGTDFQEEIKPILNCKESVKCSLAK